MGGQAKADNHAGTDVIVRITTTTICGTDLHILKGDVPAITDGRILGHEGVGIIEAVGLAVIFDICQAIIAPGGRIANVGVHGKSVEFHLERSGPPISRSARAW